MDAQLALRRSQPAAHPPRVAGAAPATRWIFWTSQTGRGVPAGMSAVTLAFARPREAKTTGHTGRNMIYMMRRRKRVRSAVRYDKKIDILNLHESAMLEIGSFQLPKTLACWFDSFIFLNT